MARNLVAKINTRLGGVMNEIVKNQYNPSNKIFVRYADAPTLFLGVFSTKPSAQDTRGTVVSLSFNVDQRASRFAGIYAFPEERESDFIDEMEQLFYDALLLFVKKVARLPRKVFIFRGGLSESVVEAVSQFELELFEKAWKEAFKGRNRPLPDIFYVTVERRHNVRFQKEKHVPGRSYARSQNMDKGTVVDTVITTGKEFYLCSHEGQLGTSRPAYYRLQNHESSIAADDLEVVINTLCNLVQRSVTPVSTPAPLYYSRLLSDRVLYYLRVENSANIQTHEKQSDLTFFT